jgi:molybdopterin molybdochelatase
MISINAAQEIVLKHTTQIDSESVPLLEAIGRIIAVDMRAPHDLPLSNNSAMDGYALALRPGQEQWNVVDFIPAGLLRTAPVCQGDTVKIMTGAPVPAGCDTVVPIEDITEDGGVIRLNRSIKRGSNIRKQGEDILKGNLLIKSGHPVRPQEIGLLASFGWSTLPVYRKPRIAILATGDELLEIGSIPSPGKIINSNSYSLAAQLIQARWRTGADRHCGRHQKATRDKIVEGLQRMA